MKIKAAVAAEAGKPLVFQELELDELRRGEVRVRMVATGVCHTDILVRDQDYQTPLPAVLGHEGAGIVEAVGEGVTSVVPGDHVVLTFRTCGTCEPCQMGHPTNCLNLFNLGFGGGRADGSTAFTNAEGRAVSSHFFGQSSFADYSNVSEECLVPVDKDLPLEILGPLGCGIQTGAGAVLNVLNPEAGSSLVIFGAGAVGLSGLLAGKIANVSTLIAVDVVESRLDLATSLGATHVINGKTEDVVARIKEITGGGAKYALDSTGNKVVFRQMLDSLGTLGHAALVGAAAPGTESTIDIGSMLMTGATISMVVEGAMSPRVFVPVLVDLYHRGLFPFDRLIKEYPISDINSAIDDSLSGATLKPIVRF